MNSGKSAAEIMATICIKVDEASASQQETVSSQVKAKRRSKIKMPLKKIPKRKQTSLTEQLNLCQDIGRFDLSESLSALIVSSVQSNDENSFGLSQNKLSRSIKQTAAPTNSAHIQANSNSQSVNYIEQERTSQSSMNASLPPLVSIVRPSAPSSKTVASTATTSAGTVLSVAGTNISKVAWQLPQIGCSRTDIQLGRPNTSALPSSQSESSTMNPLTRGGMSDEYQKRLAASQPKADGAPANKVPGHFHLQPVKPNQPCGKVKVMKPLNQADVNKLLNLPADKKVPVASKSKICLKQPLCLNKQCFGDMHLPLVHVKAPAIAPISPQSKKKSLLMKKNVEEAHNAPSPKGRKYNEKFQQIKENVEVKETRSPNRKRVKTTMPCHSCHTDDDDVIITGVVHLDDLPPDDMGPLKYLKGSQHKRKSSKGSDDILQTGKVCPRSDFEFGKVSSQSNSLYCRRRQYCKKNCGKKMCKNSQEISLMDRGLRQIIGSQDEYSTEKHCDPVKPNAIKVNSTMIKKTSKTSESKDAFNWRSILNIFDEKNPKNECIEIGSGTDSGNEDDLVLRDLSEFLLLSEYRRNSKKPDMPDFDLQEELLKDPQSQSKNIDSLINFDSIDSSVNLINRIDPNFNLKLINYDKNRAGDYFDENIYYSPWQSAFDNYPKYPLQNRLKSRSENYWKRYLQNDSNPTLIESERYSYKSNFINKDRCIEEFLSEAGMILRSECAERGLAPSYESKFYRKRIYRKNKKDTCARLRPQQDFDW